MMAEVFLSTETVVLEISSFMRVVRAFTSSDARSVRFCEEKVVINKNIGRF
jgi:hypothetical protein